MYDVMDDVVYLLGLPMPPTENEMYATFGNRRISSRSLRLFQKNVFDWKLSNLMQSRRAVEKCQDWVNKGYFLRVNAKLFFPKSKLFCKDGRVKTLDASNRIKGLHDSIGKQILNIDDKFFFELSVSKTIGLKEEVNVWIEPIKTDNSDLN